MVRRAAEHGVTVAGPYGIGEKIEEIKKEAEEDDGDKADTHWEKIGDNYDGPPRSWASWDLHKDVSAPFLLGWYGADGCGCSWRRTRSARRARSAARIMTLVRCRRRIGSGISLGAWSGSRSLD